MKRRTCRGVWTAVAALLVAMALAVLPRALERMIASRLCELGFESPSVEVRSLSPRRLSMVDLTTAGARRISARSVDITYTLRQLMHGRVDTVRVQDLSVRVPAVKNRLPFFTEKEGEVPLPFRRIELGEANVTVDGLGQIQLREGVVENGLGSVLCPARKTGGDTNGSLECMLRDLTLTTETSFTSASHLPSVTAGLWRDAGGWRFRGQIGMVDGVALDIAGGWPADGSPAVERMATVGSRIMDRTEAGRRYSFLRGWEISGSPSLSRGQAAFEAGGPLVFVDLLLDNVTLSSREWDFVVSEIDGALVWRSDADSPDADVQVLTIGELRAGGVRLSEGHVRFAIGSDGNVAFRDVVFRWGGGRVGARDFLLSPRGGVLRFVLDIDNVDLGDILALTVPGRASGEGRLSGRWALTVRWQPEPSVEFGEGRLVADPSGGWFRIENPEDASTLVKTKVRGAGGIDGEMSDRITRAIHDFEYDELEIRFTETAGRLATKVHAKGRGPRGGKSLEFGGLTFNVTGLDDLLRLLIVRSRQSREQLDASLPAAGTGRQTEPEAAVQQAIETFF